MPELVSCPVCKQQVYRNKSGIFKHTTQGDEQVVGFGYFGPIKKRTEPKICTGSTRGARP